MPTSDISKETLPKYTSTLQNLKSNLIGVESIVMDDIETGTKPAYSVVELNDFSAPTDSKVDQTPNSSDRDSFDGTNLSWSNITYTIKSKADNSEKIVLNNLSGEALSGEMLAIMGTSGAGKSTLLDVLAGRLDSKGLKGQINVNGSPINKKTFRKISGYVMQSDALFPLLTVRETLRFAAYLRVANKTRAEKHAIVDNMITLLRLESCADTQVGNDQIRGVSGGEKRRVSIGVDIIHEPKVIFLDEPTSGLDSSTAFAVVDSLKHLTSVKHCTVAMTIHQPSARIFELIDKVIFLSRGRMTYSGQASKLLEFTTQTYRDIGLNCTSQANAPELFLDLSDRLQEENKIDILTQRFEMTSQSMNLSRVLSNDDDTPIQVHYANSIIGDIMIICERAMINIVRTKELFIARLFSTMFFAVLGGTLFLHPRNDDDGVFHKASFFILTLAYFNWTSLEALPIFYQERETFEREFSGGAYRAASYTIATSIVYYPFLFFLSLVYNAIAWWLVNFPSDAQLFLFQVLIIFCVLVTAGIFATTLSVLLPDPMTAQTVGSAIFAVMLVFSGFFINRSEIPDYWIYFHYLSFFKYAIDSELVNGLTGVSTDTKTNEQVLEGFSVNGLNKWQGVGILIAWALFYRSIFYYRLLTAFNGSRKQ